jgi:ABC-type transport system involved in cytochrome c biogenesis permease subunit
MIFSIILIIWIIGIIPVMIADAAWWEYYHPGDPSITIHSISTGLLWPLLIITAVILMIGHGFAYMIRKSGAAIAASLKNKYVNNRRSSGSDC